MLGLGKKDSDLQKNSSGEEITDFSVEDFREEPRVYEASYLFVPLLEEETVKMEVEKVKGLISEKGGEILHEGVPKKMLLAYKMVKSVSNKKTAYENAFFGWLKFSLSQDSINEIKRMLEKNDNIIRFLIIKTTKETPIVRPATRRVFKKRGDTPRIIKEEPQPIDEEQLDKEIEELLIS